MKSAPNCRLLSRYGERVLIPGSELTVGDSSSAAWRLPGLEPAHARFVWDRAESPPRVHAQGPVSIDAARVLSEGPLRHGAQIRLGTALIRVVLREAQAGLGSATPGDEFGFQRPGREECQHELRRVLGVQGPRLWAAAAASAGVDPDTSELADLHQILAALEEVGGLAQIAALSLQIRLRSAEAHATRSRERTLAGAPELDPLTRRRLEEVNRLRLLDPEVEALLGEVTREVSAAFELPLGLISVVLDSAQYFPGGAGLTGWIAEAGGTPSEWAFCRHVVDGLDPLVVEDARQDPLVLSNPLVTRDGIGSYAGVSLRTSRDVPIGSLCVIGTAPRSFSPEEIELLRAFAARAMAALEARVV